MLQEIKDFQRNPILSSKHKKNTKEVRVIPVEWFDWLIAELEKYQWVSVDNPPNESGIYHIANSETVYVDTVKYFPNRGWYWNGEYTEVTEVKFTHYRRLPQPPGESE